MRPKAPLPHSDRLGREAPLHHPVPLVPLILLAPQLPWHPLVPLHPWHRLDPWLLCFLLGLLHQLPRPLLHPWDQMAHSGLSRLVPHSDRLGHSDPATPSHQRDQLRQLVPSRPWHLSLRRPLPPWDHLIPSDLSVLLTLSVQLVRLVRANP